MRVAGCRKSQRGGGSSTNGEEEELAKGWKGSGKKVKLIFVRAWALSLSLFFTRSLSLSHLLFFSSFPVPWVGSKSFPCLPSRKLLGIRGTLIPQIDDFTKWYEAVWENGESHGKKDKLAQPAGCCSFYLLNHAGNVPPFCRLLGYRSRVICTRTWQTFLRDSDLPP